MNYINTLHAILGRLTQVNILAISGKNGLSCVKVSRVNFMGNIVVPLGMLLNGYTYYTAINYLCSGWIDVGSMLTIGFYLLCFGWVLLLGARRSHVDFVLDPADIMIAIFLLLIFFSFAKHGFLSPILKYIPFMIVMPYVCARFIYKSEILNFINVITILSFGIFVMGMINLHAVWQVWETAVARTPLYGSRANTVIIGMVVGALLITVAAFLLRPTKGINIGLERVILIIIPFVILLLVILAGKTALISSILISLILAAVASWSSKQLRICLVGLIIGSVLISFAVVPNTVRIFYKLQNIREIYQTVLLPLGKVKVSENDTMALRVVYTKQTLSAFLDNPFFGVGPGNTVKSHSTIVQVFAEFGLFAGIAFVGAILRVLFGLRCIAFNPESRYRAHAWILMALYFHYLLNDQTQGSIHSALPFFLLTGVAVSLISGAQPQKPSDPNLLRDQHYLTITQ